MAEYCNRPPVDVIAQALRVTPRFLGSARTSEYIEEALNKAGYVIVRATHEVEGSTGS